ncbi:MAG TPA: LD-carboxypeptidase [Bacteroidota bacterium]|nr:LD-carboxypeptidase [Bacteroidota bacterium]
MKLLQPPRLRRGDLIALISPASAPSSSDKIGKAIRYLESLGYRTTVGKHAMAQRGYLAGTDEQRASDLNEMLNDRNVKAIIALRGGYGTPRLLPLIDYRAVKKNPKVIVGYSDLTALQLALFKKTGLITFSGPMAAVELWERIDPFTEENFWELLTSPAKRILSNPPDSPSVPLRKGNARGRILGGNLALVVSMLGTPFSPEFKNAILVVEDIDEAPHRVDRMFMHLENAGILKSLRGLIYGQFTDCVPSDPSTPHLTVEEVLKEFAGRLRVPVLSGLQYGHIAKKLTIPFGLQVELNAEKGTIAMLEPAVT